MIALGPAVDMPVDVTALPVAAAGVAPNDQYADLFTAVLGQMLGDAGDDIDAGDLDDDRIEIDWDESSSIDPNELVNQLIVDAGAAIVPLPTPTVWNIELKGGSSTPSETSLVDQLENRLPEEAVAEPPVAAPKRDAELKSEAVPLELEQLESVLAAETAQPPNADPAAAVAGQSAKPERNASSSKTDKSKADAKVEAAIVRPMPAVAVERAYASHDRESAKSFDSSNSGQAHTPQLQVASQPASAPAFVVPIDVRPLSGAQASATAATIAPAAIDPSDETQLPAQIVQSIRMQAIDGGGEAIVRLRPEYLGEVVVAVKVEQGSVTAALQADSPAVRQWVERNEATLRQGLAEHGLQLDRLSVSEKAGETENERHPDRQQQSRQEPSRQQSRRRRPQDDEATFEVTV